MLQSAIEIFAQRKKMEAMRKEIKEYISWNYGPSAWDEVLHIEARDAQAAQARPLPQRGVQTRGY